MGSADGYDNERPVHPVRITRSFLMGIYEVTFDEYDRYCEATGTNKPDDGGFGRGGMPVSHVDWYDAVAYCRWLTEKEGLTACYSGGGRNTTCDFSADGYRLPTEAEWEYAARGGRLSQGYAYAGSNDPDEVAWYQATSNGRPHEVGEKIANELGLHDMSGNRFEWCWDWYAKDYYASSPVDDPQGPPDPASSKPWDLLRARRSGAWREKAESVRATARSFDGDTYPGDNGFRLARTA
jgi:formylglycine-generating enzyme required for sulfatase activity